VQVVFDEERRELGGGAHHLDLFLGHIGHAFYQFEFTTLADDLFPKGNKVVFLLRNAQLLQQSGGNNLGIHTVKINKLLEHFFYANRAIDKKPIVCNAGHLLVGKS
jgi:hypothetical protein